MTRQTRPAARWSIAGLVLVVAAVIAIWPRGEDPAPAPDAPPAPDLAAARADASLAPCPTSDAAPPAGLEELSGVRAECLADGSAVDLAKTLADRPVLVNVWATWCAPCKDELPLLASYAAEPGAVPVVGLAVQSTPEGALELLSSLKVRLPTLTDPSGAAQRALRLPVGLPASYLVGADGAVRLVESPRLFRSVAEIRQAVAAYGGEA
ncbi:MAG: redoxin family protein [Actinophytocola sp.]|uniref:TlpA family protein disulfide reductase n=1 Tax=Actinophytocola sp. TaxID=1872138 RepID=UPI00132AE6AF|nr:TlpA disulfide reductase family protein [Actinophytocola sp.]MPZ84814.1 redoxin family protein [Actinophytocola sp.]